MTLTTISFFVLYNLGVGNIDHGEQTTTIIVFAVCVIFGIISTYFLSRIITSGEDPETARAKFLSMIVGGFIVAIIFSPVPIPAIFKLILITLGGVAGFYLMRPSWTVNITSFGSAFIGAYLFFHGVSSFIGGGFSVGAI